MKKVLAIIMSAMFVVLAGCSQGKSNDSSTGSNNSENNVSSTISTDNNEGGNGNPYRVVVVLNNNLGDKTISDLAWEGAQRAATEKGMEIKVIELLGDVTKQVPTLTELAESGDWDVIVAGLFNLREAVEQVAREYPDQKFIAYDTEILFSEGGLDNCYSVIARQNEAAFLGGAVAANFTKSGYENTNEQKIIGFVGGGENTAVNDFLVGYIEGARYVDPETKVLISYVGNFTDAAKAKELAISQYQQGADVVFSVAAGASSGVLEAAVVENRYAIGVDQDQAELRISNGDQTTADHITTSVVKKMQNVVYNALVQAEEGTLAWGTHEYVGLVDDAMGLAENDIYKLQVSEEVRAQVEELKQKIISGEITVKSAIGMSSKEINEIRDQA